MSDGTPTRILWLIKGLARGGAERLVTTVATQLDPDRFRVTVAYVLEEADGFVPELEAAGIETICLGSTRTLEIGWLRRLRKLLRQQRYDLIHTQSPVPAVAARLLAPRATPIVHTEHNMWGVYHPVTRIANAITYGRNTHVFAVSDGVTGSIESPPLLGRTYPDVETLLHGVDAARAPHGPEARRQARRTLDIDDDTPVVGNVANLSPKKDHRTLFEAFELLLPSLPDAILLVIGSGPLEQQLAEDLASRGLLDRIRLLGSRSDVPDLLPAFDVFVLSSRYEGLPISLLEAMAAGVPCVATSVGGIPEAIGHNETGLLIQPGDPAALSAALTCLLGDPPRCARLGGAARSSVRSSFTPDGAVKSHEGRYETILRRHGGGGTNDPNRSSIDRG